MIKDKDPVIVDFTATWCGPCKMIGPKFVEIAKTCQKLKFIKVDVDDAEEIAAGCGISAMPTFQVFKDGEKVDEMVGADEDKLRELCMKFDK
ncbi:Thioredoxin domain-containing protein 3 [Mactra antiquata]